MSNPQLLYTMVKTESFSSKIRNKTRMSAFTTVIQHSPERPSQSNQAREGKKSFQIGKEEVKLSLFFRGHDCHIENPKDSIKKLLETINIYSKFEVKKSQCTNSSAFQCTNNEISENQVGKKQFLLQLQQKE